MIDRHVNPIYLGYIGPHLVNQAKFVGDLLGQMLFVVLLSAFVYMTLLEPTGLHGHLIPAYHLPILHHLITAPQPYYTISTPHRNRTTRPSHVHTTTPSHNSLFRQFPFSPKSGVGYTQTLHVKYLAMFINHILFFFAIALYPSQLYFTIDAYE